MSDEEIQKKMEFIVEHQAQFAASIQKLEEERIRDSARIERLEDSFQLLVQLAQSMHERLETVETKTANLEDSFQLLVRLAQSTLERLETVETKTANLEVNMAALAAAQTHADERLSALIDIVREGRNGKS